jgi:hypothetical protein
MKSLKSYLLLIVLSIFIACSKELPPANIELFANPNPVPFLGSTSISWNYYEATECCINGITVSNNSTIIVNNVIADTTLTLTGKIKAENFTKIIVIKVQEKPNHLKLIDSLTIGRWIFVETRALGLNTKPDEWNIMKDGNRASYIFETDKTYTNLNYMQLDEEFLHLGPARFSVNEDCKFVIKNDFYGIRPPSTNELLKITSDSLILYNKDQTWVWAGSGGSGSGVFPTIIKYKHSREPINFIKSNNPNTEKFKILTRCSWLLHSVRFIQNGREDLDLIDNIKYNFYSDGTSEIFDLNNKMLGNGIRWYLVDNETKFKMAGGGDRENIIKLTNDVFEISVDLFNEMGKYTRISIFQAIN